MELTPAHALSVNFIDDTPSPSADKQGIFQDDGAEDDGGSGGDGGAGPDVVL